MLPASPIPAAGLVLCGGKSSRMGRPKALLPFGPELMLQRVVRILGEVVGPIVVVAAPGQELPPLPDGVLIARDEREGRGPLEGLHAGMRALALYMNPKDPSLALRASVALPVYATSCDVPLLKPDFVREMLSRLGTHAAAVPVEEKFYHPLAAVYRLSVLPIIEELLAADQLRPAFLFDRADTCRVPVEELRRVDPELHSLKNCNLPEDYEAALRIAGV